MYFNQPVPLRKWNVAGGKAGGLCNYVLAGLNLKVAFKTPFRILPGGQ